MGKSNVLFHLPSGDFVAVLLVQPAGRRIRGGDGQAEAVDTPPPEPIVAESQQFLAQPLTAARRDGDGPVVATLQSGEQIEADEILVAVGRTPATDGLGLVDLGLQDGRYIEVDERLRAVGVPGDWLYAIGDCNGLALFTHMGKYQGRIASDVILGKDATDRSSRTAISRVTFTDPQVCAVGLTEAQAREQGLPVRVVTYGTGDVAGATVEGEGISGTSALVVDTDREIIVGATFTGPQVQELLHSASIAVAGEVPLRLLWHAVPSFPTVSEVWLRLLETYGL